MLAPWAIDEKESLRWLDSYQQTHETAQQIPETQFVCVADNDRLHRLQPAGWGSMMECGRQAAAASPSVGLLGIPL